jgi:membrane protein YdbS with pleckstrin-like domain
MTADRWLRPSPRLWRLRQLQLAVVTLPLLVAAVVAGALTAGPAGAGASALLVLAATAYALALLRRRVLSWGFAERDDDLLVRRGVLVRRLTVVPYGRMQFIDVTAGPFERAFGLATVQLHTAAAASDARIPGLDAADAARLREQLATLGESRAAGL